ncbi:MAG: histidine phosphatase family protein [Rhodovibrionaceae bacterium]
MTRLFILRHGPTAWNAEGRIQGHTDIPLSPEGEEMVRGWAIPAEFSGFSWVVSPLGRARQTAALLGARDPEPAGALMEMCWGDWEGQRLAELRERHGAEMAANEARGLDFRPPGGESPRDLRARLAPWLASVAEAGRDRIAVAHKGVIRALYTLASGWDMTGKPPEKLLSGRGHLFSLDTDGTPRCERLNIRLAKDALRDAG